MSDKYSLHFDVSGDDFTNAGMASGETKRALKQLGLNPEIIRRVAISMYEGEINLVIHAGGGEVDVDIFGDKIEIWLRDHGPGIPDVELAMREGYSTAPENVHSLGFGAGMGLPNIKKYSDELKIDTQVGVGTTLYIMIKNA